MEMFPGMQGFQPSSEFQWTPGGIMFNNPYGMPISNGSYMPMGYGQVGYPGPAAPPFMRNMLGPYADLANMFIPMLGKTVGLPGQPVGWGNTIGMGSSMLQQQAMMNHIRAASSGVYGSATAAGFGQRPALIAEAGLAAYAHGAGIIPGSAEWNSLMKSADTWGATIADWTSGVSGMVLAQMGIPVDIINPNMMMSTHATQIAMLQTGSPFTFRSAHVQSAMESTFRHFQDGGIQDRFGINASQYLSVAKSLQAFGLFNPGLVGQDGRVIDPSAYGASFSRELGARVDELLPSLNMVQGVFSNDPGISNPMQQMMHIQRITGGGLHGMSSGKVTEQVAKFRQLTQAAGIAAETLEEFIDSTVKLGERMGIKGKAGLAAAALSAFDRSRSYSRDYNATVNVANGGMFIDPNEALQAQTQANTAAVGSEVGMFAAGMESFAAVNRIKIAPIDAKQYVLDAGYRSRVINDAASQLGIDPRLIDAYLSNPRNVERGFKLNPGIGQMVADVQFLDVVTNSTTLKGQAFAGKSMEEKALLAARVVNAAGTGNFSDDDLKTLGVNRAEALAILADFAGNEGAAVAYYDARERAPAREIMQTKARELMSLVDTLNPGGDFGTRFVNAMEKWKKTSFANNAEFKQLMATAGGLGNFQMFDLSDKKSAANFYDVVDKVKNATDPDTKEAIRMFLASSMPGNAQFASALDQLINDDLDAPEGWRRARFEAEVEDIGRKAKAEDEARTGIKSKGSMDLNTILNRAVDFITMITAVIDGGAVLVKNADPNALPEDSAPPDSPGDR